MKRLRSGNVAPLAARDVEVGLVQQRRGAEGHARAPLRELAARHAVQLGVQTRKQRVRSALAVPRSRDSTRLESVGVMNVPRLDARFPHVVPGRPRGPVATATPARPRCRPATCGNSRCRRAARTGRRPSRWRERPRRSARRASAAPDSGAPDSASVSAVRSVARAVGRDVAERRDAEMLRHRLELRMLLHQRVQMPRQPHVVADHLHDSRRDPTCRSASHTFSARKPREFCGP